MNPNMVLKKGQRVKCIRVEYGNETVGNVYTVRRDSESGNMWVEVEMDDKRHPNDYRKVNFELVEEIKIGDRYEWLGNSGLWEPGDVGRVTAVHGDLYTLFHERLGQEAKCKWLLGSLSWRKIEGESLEPLVEIVNKGLQALTKIHSNPEWKGKTEYSDAHTSWQCLENYGHNSPALRLKPLKPKLPEVIPVGPWFASFTSSRIVNVGCKTFEVRVLREALTSILTGGLTYTTGFFTDGVLFRIEASRNGLVLVGTSSWLHYEEADKLLKWLGPA